MKNIQKKSYLYEQVRGYLADLIETNRGNPNFRLPTEQALVDEFHISRITARKAFDELTQAGLLVRYKGRGTFIAPEADEAALQRFAESAPHEKKIVGIVIPSIVSEHVTRILHSIHLYCEAEHLPLDFRYAITDQDADKETEAIRKLLLEGVDGFLIYPVDGATYNHSLIKLSFQNFPLVLIDRVMPGLNFNLVASDNRSAFLSAVELLVQKGHQKIAIFDAYPYHVSTIEDRIHACEEGLKHSNLVIHSDFELFAPRFAKQESAERETEVYDAVVKQLEELILSDRITAVICMDVASSTLLLRLLNRLEEQYITIKNRLSVVYCDLEPAALEFAFPSPTCIQQDSMRVGTEAIKLLLELFASRTAEHKIVKVPCMFFPGRSVHEVK